MMMGLKRAAWDSVVVSPLRGHIEDLGGFVETLSNVKRLFCAVKVSELKGS